MIRALILSLLLLPTSLIAGTPAGALIKKPDTWFSSDEGRRSTDCILSWQSSRGDWPKNTDTTRKEYSGDKSKLKGTFDNGATTDELRLLARAYRITGNTHCQKAVLLGFDHILKAQYANGGFPQYFPPGKNYPRHITFNDNSMVRLLEFLRECATSKDYAFLDKTRRSAAQAAFNRGIDCIIKCQIIIKSTPTVWCAQHDELTLKPADARSYELASLSGAESADIILLLMSLENPNPEVIHSVKAGVAWFESAKIEGLRYEKRDGNRVLVMDQSAPPIWARFYEIGTNRPFFCDRDGVIKYDVSEIGSERRNGYAWYGNWGDKVAKAYAKWPHR